jgi:hypothetical protein
LLLNTFCLALPCLALRKASAMLDYIHQQDLKKPYSVYRLMNHRTGRFYIGSSAKVAERFEYHKNAIRHMNHSNVEILHDSLLCDLEDWSFRLLSRHATHIAMAKREMAVIKIFVGRKTCYNRALHYADELVSIEWIVFNLKNGRSSLYLNRRSALRDLDVTLEDFTLNCIDVLQYEDYLLFKPGSGTEPLNNLRGLDERKFKTLEKLLYRNFSDYYIYNFSLNDEAPMSGSIKRFQDLLRGETTVKKLLNPDSFENTLTMSRTAIDNQVREGHIVVTKGKGRLSNEIVSLTDRGRNFAHYFIRSRLSKFGEGLEEVQQLESFPFGYLLDLARREKVANVAMREAVQLARRRSELDRLPKGQYLVAVDGAKHLNFHKFVVGDNVKKNLSQLSRFGGIFGVMKRVDQPVSRQYTISYCVATRDGYCGRFDLPEDEEYKRKRSAWKHSYRRENDCVVSMFPILIGDTYIVAITTTGQALVFDSNHITVHGIESFGMMLVKPGSAPLATVGCIKRGGRLLAITQKGFALPLTAEGKYIGNRADCPRKITNYEPNMGPVLLMMPLDCVSGPEQNLEFMTSDGREVVLRGTSVLTDADEKPKRLLDLAGSEVIISVDPVSIYGVGE